VTAPRVWLPPLSTAKPRPISRARAQQKAPARVRGEGQGLRLRGEAQGAQIRRAVPSARGWASGIGAR
jgi:hypothetical protein